MYVEPNSTKIKRSATKRSKILLFFFPRAMLPSRNQIWINCGKAFFTVGSPVFDKKSIGSHFRAFKGFWMSDKPLVQQALATELAETLLAITSMKASLAFLQGFWECTVREWNGIDYLR